MSSGGTGAEANSIAIKTSNPSLMSISPINVVCTVLHDYTYMLIRFHMVKSFTASSIYQMKD